MSARVRALGAGMATGIGSLPHTDAGVAARLVLDLHPRLPAAPELPMRDEREGMLARWLDGDGVALNEEAHGGLLRFVDETRSRPKPPGTVKVQVAGPLTLGVALTERGLPAEEAFEQGAAASRSAASSVTGLLDDRLPSCDRVLFLDEPALTIWRDGEGPIGREDAVDLVSAVLSSVDAVTGVHVCGDGDARMAIEAGPDVVSVPVTAALLDHGVALARFLDAGGWIAWGAVPTDRPVGERVDHCWNELASLWCDLTRAGCDPVLLRTQALITPACGLAQHSEGQAQRILGLCVEIGERVREQAIATRLSVGA